MNDVKIKKSRIELDKEQPKLEYVKRQKISNEHSTQWGEVIFIKRKSKLELEQEAIKK